MLLSVNNKYKVFAVIAFLVSTLITWWFIVAGKRFYINADKMQLSMAIAGAKWLLQIVAALLFMGALKWRFIYNIGLICLTGSCLLLPFCLPFISLKLSVNAFIYFIAVAVIIMIAMYYNAVSKIQLSKVWFWAWVVCLAIAISLQVFLVF